jgi:two-component system phosphate regulon sensor histidine kinase PhoR
MWTSRLFWKLFLAHAALAILSAILFAWLVSNPQSEQVLRAANERFYDVAVLLRSRVVAELAAERTDGLQALIQQLGVDTATRLTVLGADGRVLADSDQDPARMENHLQRGEVVQAATKGVGVATHPSRTLGIAMSYLALRVDHAGRRVGFVRIAAPQAQLEQQVAATRRLVWAAALVVGGAAVGLTGWLVGRITRPVRLLTQVSQAIAAGQYGQRVYLTQRDELGALADSFNRMSAELAEKITQMRGDRELFSAVLGGMVEGIVAVDALQRVRFVNDAARTLLRLGPDAAGRPIWELVRHPAVQQAVRAVCQGVQPTCQLEFEMPAADRRLVALRADRLRDGDSAGALVVLHDVTDLRRLERLRHEFVANVSHELKTPLSSIKAYAETLLSGALDDPEHNVAFLRRIDEQADRLHALILDLLRLAQVESGAESFERAAVLVEAVVTACISEHAAAAAKKGLVLEAQPGQERLAVLADQEAVHTILDNLLDNAIKYTPAGGRVTVRCLRDGVQVCVQVSDTGVGIAPVDQARIFERFYRVDKARSRELGGTGLGLSIVKHFAQALGGSVAVASEPGRGSTFSVLLPAADTPPAESASPG